MPTPLKNTNTRILRYLQGGRDITATQARQRFGITNVSARISELRQAGFPIYLNTRKVKTTGRTIKAYRLGTPTRRVIATGQLVANDPYFGQLLKPEVDQNLSLVAAE